jgi:hypothetical protein
VVLEELVVVLEELTKAEAAGTRSAPQAARRATAKSGEAPAKGLRKKTRFARPENSAVRGASDTLVFRRSKFIQQPAAPTSRNANFQSFTRS